jgi:hypothetical protein
VSLFSTGTIQAGQTKLCHLICAVQIAEKYELKRLCASNALGELDHATLQRDDAKHRFRTSESRGPAGDNEITTENELQSSAHTASLHGCHGRNRQLLELIESLRESFDLWTQLAWWNARPIAHIATKAEVLSFGAKQEHLGRAVCHTTKRCEQFLPHPEVDTVTLWVV